MCDIIERKGGIELFSDDHSAAGLANTFLALVEQMGSVYSPF
jgi:hypothetical protein